MSDEVKRIPIITEDNSEAIQDVEGQQRWDIDPNADGAEEIAGDLGEYEFYKAQREKELVYDESKTTFSLEFNLYVDWDEDRNSFWIRRFSGARLDFLECNETAFDCIKTVARVQFEDKTRIFENGDDTKLVNKISLYDLGTEEQRRAIKCDALANLCVKEILEAEYLPRLNSSELTIKEKRSFFRKTAETIVEALTRETKDHEGRCLRGQRGAHGSESFRANVKEFVRGELDRLAKREFRYTPLARVAGDEFRESVIVKHTPPRKLKTLFAAELVGQTSKQKEDFIAQIQREARESVFNQDDGNGIAMLSQILLDERLERIRLYNLKESAKRTRQRTSKKAAAKEKAQEEISPVENLSELDVADILKHSKELERGYLPRGPKGRAFAIYADTILKEQNRPHDGRDGKYHREQSEKALAKMAVYKDPNKRSAISLFSFTHIDFAPNGEPLERPVWVMWAASDWIFFPHPIKSEPLIPGGYQKDVLIPSMFAKIYALAFAQGLELSTAGALNKTVLFIASSLQTEIDGAAANVRDYGGTVDTPTAEGELSGLPIPPHRHSRKKYLDIVREALAVAGITFETTARGWKAYRIDAQITTGQPDILPDGDK